MIRDIKNINEKLKFIFISLFKIKKKKNIKIDSMTRIFHIYQINQLNMIEMKNIEYEIHLILKFEREINEIIIMKYIIKEKRMIIIFEEMNLDEMIEDNAHDKNSSENV